MQKLIFILIFLFPFRGFSQDTIKVYFEFGSSKIVLKEASKFQTLSTDYNLSLLSHIEFIGYTDSIGKPRANLRLSKKRAKNIYKTCIKSLPENIPFKIKAKGEGKNDEEWRNRRVEMILYYQPEQDTVVEEVIENVDPKCFYIDFLALRQCNLRTITKRRKQYIYIEATLESGFKKSKHYYVKKDGKGNVKAVKLKWSIRNTGNFWWRKKRLVTTIPKSSYDQFQFFSLAKAPCTGCTEKIFSTDTIIRTIRRKFPDLFLMSNMQAKVPFFGGNKAKIRVPREYVNEKDRYWYSYYNNYYSHHQVKWGVKKAKRKKAYYYTKIPLYLNRMPVIKRSDLTSVCVGKYSNKDTLYAHEMSCGGVFNKPKTEFQWNINPGAFYQNDTVMGFVATGVSYTTDNSYTALNVGINTRIGFYGSFSTKYHLFSFPFRMLSPVSQWQNPAPVFTINKYGRFYLGGELKTSFNKFHQSFFEGNLHIGLTVVNTTNDWMLPRIYMQYGLGKDFLIRTNEDVYSIVQVGMTINLSSFFINSK